jgi:dTMP kinase
MTLGTSGIFITFEGGEGCGKTTQIQHLARWIESNFDGLSAHTTREPGGTDDAELIRELLVNGAANRWRPATEALMMSAARHEHVVGVIRPALERGKIVISDRFIDSTHVYQGYVGGISSSLLDALDELSCGDLRPDLSFFLDINSGDGLARATQRGVDENRFEAKGAKYHEQVRQGFLRRTMDATDRIVKIDANRSEEEIAKEIAFHVGQLFAARGIS